MLYTVYRCLTDAAGPLVPFMLRRRLRRGKEDASRLSERLGVDSRPRPPGRLIWIHGASVGETLGALPLIQRLMQADPTVTVMITSGTVTSANMMASRLPKNAFHCYLPIDRRRYVDRFLSHWQPDAVVWIESDLWPNMLAGIRERRIPAALVNARVSEATARRWRRAPSFFASIIDAFDLICPASAGDAAAFSSIDPLRLGPVGNIKTSAPAQPPDIRLLETLNAAIGDRPVWLAASTHDGEEAIVLDAHNRLRGTHPNLLLVLIPRHPNRADAIHERITAAGFTVAQRSRSDPIDRDTAVYLADTMGEMPTFLALAPVTFVGGSLVPMGGHNPVEAADAGSAVLMGPHDWAFADVVQALEAQGGMQRVSSSSTLSIAVDRLLSDPAQRKAQTTAASNIAHALKSTVDRIAAAVIPLLTLPAPDDGDPP